MFTPILHNRIKRRIDAKGKDDKFTTQKASMLIIKVKICTHIGQVRRNTY